MIERIILLASITLLIAIVLWRLKQHQLKHAQTAASTINGSLQPQLIYFWSTQCSQCKTIQTPIIDKLKSAFVTGELAVIKYNVNESPEQAKNWSVKTVPTTYVLDRSGAVRHINNGLVTERRLLSQLDELRMS